MNFIKQITTKGGTDAQSIKMVVRSNERGPQGEQGEKGDAATLEAGNVYSIPEGQTPQVINAGTSSNAVFDFYLPKGPKGDDGAIHYTAGTGINITDGNVIEATGASVATWGDIQGDIDDQTDLQTALQNTASTAETASKNYTDTQLAGYAKTTDIPTVNNATLTIQNNGTNVATFTANSSTDTTANIVPPVQIGSVLSTPTSVEYVGTANLFDGAVTTAKLAQFAGNNAIITATNVQPLNDTPTEWLSSLGGPYTAGQGGYWVTYYNTTGKFTNQPSQYGWLETISEGADNIYQRWTTGTTGQVLYRLGDSSGWWSQVGGNGTFKQLETLYGPGDTINIGLTPTFINVEDNPAKAKLFIQLSRGVRAASSITLTTGAGSSTYGYVVDNAGAIYHLQLAANQTATGYTSLNGVYFDVNLANSIGTVYANGLMVMSEGSISFS